MLEQLLAAIQQLTAALQSLVAAVKENSVNVLNHTLAVNQQKAAVEQNTAEQKKTQDAVANNTAAVAENTEALKNVNFKNAGSNAVSNTANSDDTVGSNTIIVANTVPNTAPSTANVVVINTDTLGQYDSSDTSLIGFNRRATWNNIVVGPAADDRIVVFALGTRDAAAGNRAYINDQVANLIEVGNGNKALSLIAYAHIPSGITANLSVDFVAWPSDIGGQVFSVLGADANDVFSKTLNGQAVTLGVDVTTKAGSAAIGTGYFEDWDGSAGNISTTWTGLRKITDLKSGTHTTSQAVATDLEEKATLPVTLGWNAASSEDTSLAVVVFNPKTQASSNTSSNTIVTSPPPVSTNTVVQEQSINHATMVSIVGPIFTGNHPMGYSNGWDDGRTYIVPDPEDNTHPVLRCLFRAGTRGHIQFNKDLGGSFDEAILEYKLRFESADGSSVDFKRGGKLPGLAGGTAPSGGQSAADGLGFNTRFMWIEESLSSPDTRFSEYIYDMDGNGNHLYLNTDNPMTLRTAGNQWNNGPPNLVGYKWYSMKQHVKMNTPGSRNGVMKAWVDDLLALDMNNVRFRSTNSVGIEALYFSTFFGGSNTTEWQASKDTYIYYADFKITLPQTGQVITINFPKG